MKSLLIAVLALIAVAGSAFAQDIAAPYAASILVSTGKTTGVVTFLAPGDQCNSNTLAAYDIRYSTSTITECNFTSANSISSGTPQSPGTEECFEVSSLSCNTTYYWAVKVKDAAGNWSVLSNVVTKATRACNQNQEVLCD